MAHFAEIDTSNVTQVPLFGGGTTSANQVLRVLVVPDAQEGRGQAYLADDCSLGGNWVQCSYNATICKRFPGMGYLWLPEVSVFAKPKPAANPSWVLDGNYEWTPPVAKPDDGRYYRWDEASVSWVVFTPPSNGAGSPSGGSDAGA
jgi:hypothetical protein